MSSHRGRAWRRRSSPASQHAAVSTSSKWSTAGWLVAVGLCLGVAFWAAAASRLEPPPSFAAVIAKVDPATVGVYAAPRPGPIGDAAPLPNIGSGFLIDSDGIVATAAHVVEDCETIVVRTSGGRVEPARILAINHEADLALLKVPPGLSKTPAFGRSRDLRPGDWVLAIGEPFGLGRSVSLGIVGSLERHFSQDENLLFIQSDVSVNPGNSGGPLLDAKGRIVGMNVRIIAAAMGMAGMSLSVPIETVLRESRDLLSGSESLPSFDAQFDDLPPLQAWDGQNSARGAVVLQVAPGGLADRLGLQAGDRITAFGAQRVDNSVRLAQLLDRRRPAEPIRLTVQRAGQSLQLSLAAETPLSRSSGASETNRHEYPQP